jgi:hypothetical protein
VDYRRQVTLYPEGRLSYQDPEGEWDAPLTDPIALATSLCEWTRPLLEDATWQLLSVTSTLEETRIAFGVEVGGIPILGRDSAYALFRFSGENLVEMSIKVRRYHVTELTTVSLPIAQLLARAPGQNSIPVSIGYIPVEKRLEPVWVTEENDG